MNNPFTPRTAFGIVILSLLLSTLLTSVVIVLLQDSSADFSFWPGVLILGEFLLILPLLIFISRRTNDVRSALRLNRVPRRMLGLTAIVSPGVIVWTDELDRLLVRFLPTPDWTEQFLGFLRGDDLLSLLLLFFGSVVVAAVAEEILFRGFLQNVLEKYWKDVTRAVLITSLFFAFIHMSPSWIIQIYLLALVMGYRAWRSNSVFPSMILHGLNNGLAFLFVNWGEYFESWYVWRGHVSPFILTGSAALTYMGFRRMAHLSAINYEAVQKKVT